MTFARLTRKPLSAILSKLIQLSFLHLSRILAVVYHKKRKSYRKFLGHLKLSAKSHLLISTTFASAVAASTSAVVASAFTVTELGATTVAITLAVFVIQMN